MTTVYLIRHGETEWNRDGIHQGHLDSPLTGHGRRQAGQLGERLARSGVAFDAVYSSDLGRCLATAEGIAAPLGWADRIVPEPRLRERALGILEGLTYPQIAERLPEDHRLHTSGDPLYRPDGGESWTDLYERSRAILGELAARHDGGTILVVSHGGVVAMAMRECLGIDLLRPRRFHIPNTALNILERHDAIWELRTWGDVAHFEGERALDEML